MVKTIRIENIPEPLYVALKKLKKKYKASTWVEFLWIVKEHLEI